MLQLLLDACPEELTLYATTNLFTEGAREFIQEWIRVNRPDVHKELQLTLVFG